MLCLTEIGREEHAELVAHVEDKLRPVGESLVHLIPYLQEARARYAHPGRRVPVPGQPTFTEWIRKNLGISDRHVLSAWIRLSTVRLSRFSSAFASNHCCLPAASSQCA
jgi:hypothetical protein